MWFYLEIPQHVRVVWVHDCLYFDACYQGKDLFIVSVNNLLARCELVGANKASSLDSARA